MMASEDSGGHELHLVGLSVGRCIVDFAFTLHLVGDESERAPGRGGRLREGYLQIGGPFECVVDGATTRCDPEHDPTRLGPALALFRRSVKAAIIDAKGGLHLEFDGQAALWVPSDPHFESWDLHDSDGTLIISGPGGRISVFPPLPPQGTASQ